MSNNTVRPPRDGDEFSLAARFVIIPCWLMDRGVSSRALHVYALLYGLADRDTRTAWPSRRWLADQLATGQATSVSTVDRAVRELIAARAISRRPRWDAATGSQRSSVYVVHSVPYEASDPVSPVTTPRVTSDKGAVDRSTNLSTPSSPVTRGGVTSDTGPVSPVTQIPKNQLPRDTYPTRKARTDARTRELLEELECEHETPGGARLCAFCRRTARQRAELEERGSRIVPPPTYAIEEVDR